MATLRDIQVHWNEIYNTKTDEQKSWFQAYPDISVRFLQELNVPKSAAIIDAGGGDSRLVDALLDLGYSDITVLDISAAALANAKRRLGEKAAKVKWIESDVLEFKPTVKYDCWHDRAVFHFITDDNKIASYKKLIAGAIRDNGKLIIGTFSEKGPDHCSGLQILRYSQQQLTDALAYYFRKIKCIEQIHQTPFQTTQFFTFCSFQKRQTGIAKVKTAINNQKVP